jgi:hypothetical protein
MLIEVDSSQLGDTHLSPEEAIIREREELLKKASKHRIWGQTELEDSGRTGGSRLYYTEVIRRIRNINPAIMIREGSDGQVAIYRPKRHDEYDWEQFDPKVGADWRWDHEYVSGMPKDWLPEYSGITLDSSNLPTREFRGWRSILIALVKGGAISYSESISEFGDPSNDRRSGLWFEQLSKQRSLPNVRFAGAEKK